jgi:uncharacterized small protein (TIGR04563 family)
MTAQLPKLQSLDPNWVVLSRARGESLACPREYSHWEARSIPISVQTRPHVLHERLEVFARNLMQRRVRRVDELDRREFLDGSWRAISFDWTDGVLDLETEFVDLGAGTAIEINYAFDPHVEGAPPPDQLRARLSRHVALVWPQSADRPAPPPADAGKRKQSLYFPESMLDEIKSEAARLDRSLSWVVQRAWRASRHTIRRIPDDEDVGESEDRAIVEKRLERD